VSTLSNHPMEVAEALGTESARNVKKAAPTSNLRAGWSVIRGPPWLPHHVYGLLEETDTCYLKLRASWNSSPKRRGRTCGHSSHLDAALRNGFLMRRQLGQPRYKGCLAEPNGSIPAYLA
jgi:hypothetical protein